TVSVPNLVEWPQGSAEDLHRRSLDPSILPWERGKAAFAEGRSRAGSGDRDGALDAYRRAFELVRSVFPFYAGVDPEAQPDTKPLVWNSLASSHRGRIGAFSS